MTQYRKTYEATSELATIVRLDEVVNGDVVAEWIVRLYASGGVEIEDAEDGTSPVGGVFIAIEDAARTEVAA